MSCSPWKTLGIRRSASSSEVKQAFLSLAKKHHPDVCDAPDSAEKFAEIKDAYDAILNSNGSGGAAGSKYGQAAGFADDATAMAARVRQFK